jgi:hypothetical protein
MLIYIGRRKKREKRNQFLASAGAFVRRSFVPFSVAARCPVLTKD